MVEERKDCDCGDASGQRAGKAHAPPSSHSLQQREVKFPRVEGGAERTGAVEMGRHRTRAGEGAEVPAIPAQPCVELSLLVRR